MSAHERPRPIRIGAYGFFGMGNLGNEGSLAAFIAQLRRTHPDASLSCFGVDVDAVRREHGIPSVQLMTYRARPGASGPGVLARKALGRLWDIPRTLWLVGKVDVLVVPGTGILESRLMSTPWGLPYWLFLAVASCRLRGRPVALVSVGAEPAPHPMTRRLMGSVVRLADYVTYRDSSSVDAARSMGSAGTPGSVYPDLAFALRPPSGIGAQQGHVAIGVMTFHGGADDPGRGEAVVDRYVDTMVQMVGCLCDRGRTVTLLVGDRADHELADHITELVRARRPHLRDGAVAASRADGLDALMKEMARAEVVVASRFHNVICALMVARPTVSLGYARKNADLLDEFGLGAYTQPMDGFDVHRAVADVEAAARRRTELEPRMQATLESFRGRLGEQMTELSRTVFDTAPRTRRSRWVRELRGLVPRKQARRGQHGYAQQEGAEDVGHPVGGLHQQGPRHDRSDGANGSPRHPVSDPAPHEEGAPGRQEGGHDVARRVAAPDTPDVA